MSAARLTGPMTPRALQNTARVVWVAMNLSIGVLGAVVFLIARDGPAETPNVVLARVFEIAAVALGMGAIAVRRLGLGDVGLGRLVRKAAAAPAPETALIAGLQTPFVICMALHEAIALLGFLLGVQSHDASYAWPFFSAALVLNLLAFPQPVKWVARARELALEAGIALFFLLAVNACSFRGGDFAPLAKEPETPCSKQAEAFCNEHLGSENLATCVKREKFRCELLEQEAKPEDTDK